MHLILILFPLFQKYCCEAWTLFFTIFKMFSIRRILCSKIFSSNLASTWIYTYIYAVNTYNNTYYFYFIKWRVFPINIPIFIILQLPSTSVDSMSIPICNRLLRDGRIGPGLFYYSLRNCGSDSNKQLTEDQIEQAKLAEVSI